MLFVKFSLGPVSQLLVSVKNRDVLASGRIGLLNTTRLNEKKPYSAFGVLEATESRDFFFFHSSRNFRYLFHHIDPFNGLL